MIKLKTDEELVKIISDFGDGELEFYTGDVSRLLMDKKNLEEILTQTHEIMKTFDEQRAYQYLTFKMEELNL